MVSKSNPKRLARFKKMEAETIDLVLNSDKRSLDQRIQHWLNITYDKDVRQLLSYGASSAYLKAGLAEHPNYES